MFIKSLSTWNKGHKFFYQGSSESGCFYWAIPLRQEFSLLKHSSQDLGLAWLARLTPPPPPPLLLRYPELWLPALCRPSKPPPFSSKSYNTLTFTARPEPHEIIYLSLFYLTLQGEQGMTPPKQTYRSNSCSEPERRWSCKPGKMKELILKLKNSSLG